MGEQRNDLEHFEERPGPAMGEDQRDGCRSCAALVNEVNFRAFQAATIVMKNGELLHLRFPVEMILPVGAELPQEIGLDTIFPAGTGNFIGPAGLREAQSEIFYGCAGVGKREGFYAHARGTSG